jgi:hypothetical protein
VFTSFTCNEGACSPQKPAQCPKELACNAAGTGCEGTCDPANGTADCATGWYCNAGTCTPQIQNGACVANAECASNVCGITGTGHCCTQTACTLTTPPCGANDCDGVTGECSFPAKTTSCGSGTISCPSAGFESNPNTLCDGVGDCVPPAVTNCAPYACAPATGCATTCATTADCAKNFYCSGSQCIPQNLLGPCTENDACLSFQCGVNGTGNCCFTPCGNTDPTCNITDCDPNDGSCLYPGSSQACGTVLESCTGLIQQNPSVCDGMGNCPTPGTTNCTPFICGASACLTTCSSNADCATGDNCVAAQSVCCPPLPNGGTLSVDSVQGSDSAGCCGLTGYAPCQTIGAAMKAIDAAQASNVTINASVGGAGNGGDWGFANESIPITLGWGVELYAPGVNFGPEWANLGFNGGSLVAYSEIFDVAQYSANDTLKYASIAGDPTAGLITIGADSSNGAENCIQNAAIQVEDGARLYLANANVYSNWEYQSEQGNGYWSSFSPVENAAIVVAPGGHLTLGQDESAAETGTVQIGTTSSTQTKYEGWIGIACQTDGSSLGCTIDDATLPAGTSSLVMAGMIDQDIDAEDFASITLNSAPTFGLFPSSAGFLTCTTKLESKYSEGPAILLNGFANVSLTGASITCVKGQGISMNTSPNGNGNPTLTLSGATISNTELGVYASAGSATISNSNIWYNYNGVEQDTDGTNVASFDLSGGASGTSNTLVCASGTESYTYSWNNCYIDNSCPTPAVVALNTTADTMKATNVVWDTKKPDVFSCNAALTTCTCESAGGCTDKGGQDNMDAVYESTGKVTTTNNTLSSANCTAPAICEDNEICGSGEVCCYYDYEEGYEYFCEEEEYCPGGIYEY